MRAIGLVFGVKFRRHWWSCLVLSCLSVSDACKMTRVGPRPQRGGYAKRVNMGIAGGRAWGPRSSRGAAALKRNPANSSGGARRAQASVGGITGAQTALHLHDLQVLVELDGDERAAGLGHVHLVHAVTGVGLDPVDGATRNRLERRRTERRGRGARYALLVGTDRLGAAGSGRPRVTAARGRRGAAACRGSTRGRAQRAGEDATADDARSQQTHGACPPFLAPAGVRRVGHGVISFVPWPPNVATLAPTCLRHLSAPSDRAMSCL